MCVHVGRVLVRADFDEDFDKDFHEGPRRCLNLGDARRSTKLIPCDRERTLRGPVGVMALTPMAIIDVAQTYSRIEPQVQRSDDDRGRVDRSTAPNRCGPASALKYLVEREIVATRHVSTGMAAKAPLAPINTESAIDLDIDAHNSYGPRAKVTVVLSSNNKNGLWLVGFR
jgi:hypothetical protein